MDTVLIFLKDPATLHSLDESFKIRLRYLVFINSHTKIKGKERTEDTRICVCFIKKCLELLRCGVQLLRYDQLSSIRDRNVVEWA